MDGVSIFFYEVSRADIIQVILSLFTRILFQELRARITAAWTVIDSRQV